MSGYIEKPNSNIKKIRNDSWKAGICHVCMNYYDSCYSRFYGSESNQEEGLSN
jgi:hypothetical protein